MREQRKLPHEERLALAVAFLQRLSVEPLSCADPSFCKALEERIVHRELLDFELQAFDEETERLSEVALQNLRVLETAITADAR